MYWVATNTWELQRLRGLDQTLSRLQLTNPLVMQISDRLEQFAQTELPLSAVYHEFQLNLRKFCEMVTGDKEPNANLVDTFKKLRDCASHRQQPGAPLYDTMRDLRVDIARKQQIITCLGFRHVLEELPDRGETARHFVNPTLWGASGHWRMTWQFVIERELVLLLYEQVYRMATSASPTRAEIFVPPLAGAPARPTVDGSDDLRQIILYDFGEWVKKHTTAMTRNGAAIIAEYIKVENAGAAYAAAAAVAPAPRAVVAPAPLAVTTLYPPSPPAAGATGAAAPVAATTAPVTTAPTTTTPAGNANSLPETTFTHLFTRLNLQYGTWNSYERGLGLYSELSSSIHKYNKQYEVDETNWGRSDFFILKWLKPTVDDHGHVDWNSARAERGLPYTP